MFEVMKHNEVGISSEDRVLACSRDGIKRVWALQVSKVQRMLDMYPTMS